MAALPGNEISASGRTSVKLNLTSLQSIMKVDPEGYSSELSLVYDQFKSSLDLFHQQASLNYTSISGISADHSVAKDLGSRAMFLAHIIDIAETLEVFMVLQTLRGKVLRQLAFSHVIKSIRRMNQKHKNDLKNKALQNILLGMLQQEEEAISKLALITLCDLHRRKVWCDDRTANAICMACFHPSTRNMIAALSFLLDFEKIEDDDSDDSDSQDDQATPQPQVFLSKEAMYKANFKGTPSSKKKKVKLQRFIRNLKKQQRLSSEKSNTNYSSPLNHLIDAQGFSEKLFSRVQFSTNEKFEAKMMMLKVIARTIGLHHLILLNFYSYLQKYVQPHRPELTTLLAAAVQACHEMVTSILLAEFMWFLFLILHLLEITVGLNVIREICLRMPLLMTEELLQDLVLYRKSHEKAVSASSRSLLTLFREIWPIIASQEG
ncbi:hypothetical protein SASPL_102070 [Salvia splendens]|uniref:Protein SDA1 n=1 Tax=Salvia splendens TaxID=180675 RepID=A0A8X9AE45_SALSN|nr:hypothetical protein SASPL_102070 [Salvia splendens]